MTGSFPVQPAPGASAASADVAAMRVPVAGRVSTGGPPAAGEASIPGEDVVRSQTLATLPLLLGALASAERSSAPSSAVRLMEAVLQLARGGHMPESLAGRLLELLTPPSIEGDTRALARTIQQQVEHGGLLLEAQIARALEAGTVGSTRVAADLRAVLGQLVAALEPMDDATAGSARPVATSAAAVARDLATDALVGQLQTAADVARHGIWRFDLSLILSGRAVPAAVEWEPDGESRPDGRGAARRGRVSVFIDVSASGIEARVAWSPSTLQVDLFAGSDSVRDRLLAAMEALTVRLSSLGFSHIIANAWTNPARLARWRTGASPDTPAAARVFKAEA